MTTRDNSIQELVTSQEAFKRLVRERLPYAVRIALIEGLKEEVTAFIGANPL